MLDSHHKHFDPIHQNQGETCLAKMFEGSKRKSEAES